MGLGHHYDEGSNTVYTRAGTHRSRPDDYWFKGSFADLDKIVNPILQKGIKAGYSTSGNFDDWQRLGYKEFFNRTPGTAQFSDTFRDRFTSRSVLKGGQALGHLRTLAMSPEYRNIIKNKALQITDPKKPGLNKGNQPTQVGDIGKTNLNPTSVIDKSFLGQRDFLKIGGDDTKALGWFKDSSYGSSGFGMKDINRLFDKGGGDYGDFKSIVQRAQDLKNRGKSLAIGGKVLPLLNYDWGDGDAKAFGMKDYNALISRGLNPLGIKKLWEGTGKKKGYKIGSEAAKKIANIKDVDPASTWKNPSTTKKSAEDIVSKSIKELTASIGKLTGAGQKRTMSIAGSQSLQGTQAAGVGARRSARFKKGLTSKGTSQLARSGRALAKSLNIA